MYGRVLANRNFEQGIDRCIRSKLVLSAFPESFLSVRFCNGVLLPSKRGQQAKIRDTTIDCSTTEVNDHPFEEAQCVGQPKY
jgi:hypothetical protein